MFERSADCNQILDMLRMHGMISTLDMQRLQAETTQMDRNRFVKLCRFNAYRHHWLTYILMKKCFDVMLRSAKLLPDYFEKLCKKTTNLWNLKKCLNWILIFYYYTLNV